MPRGGHRQGAGRKSSWKHHKTTVIRVPEAFADQLMDLAKKFDSGDYIELVSKSEELVDLPQDFDVVPGQMSLLEDDVLFADSILSLNQTELSRRLKVDPSTVRKMRLKKSKEQFAVWSQSKDPDDHAWQYDARNKLYTVISDFVIKSKD